jgi:hypothetical protein
MLMLSPEILTAHEVRYSDAASLIASAMKGQLVVRQPRLVLLCTTSLYGSSSSQYNRIRIPKAALPIGGDLGFQVLGLTEGFGSFHFSSITLELGERLVAQKRLGRRVNSIFGEGVNPKLRKLRDALTLAGFPTEHVLRHGSPRLIYAAPLASNFREVLIGRSTTPEYLFPKSFGEEGTQLLARFWRERWLAKRISSPGVLDAVSLNTLVYPVRHGGRAPRAELPEDYAVDK